jgi:predicted transcriptional regulator
MVNHGHGVLMSIKPGYAEAILNGTKTVELRRRRPSFGEGTTVVVYSSSPQQRVEGTFTVGRLLEAAPEQLWDLVSHRAGIDRPAFDAYFAGCPTAYAIEVRRPRRIKPARLRLRPPQSYLFLRSGVRQHRPLLRLVGAS